MKLPQAGGCLCGKIRYEITEAPRSVYTCHCTDCQHLTSSAFSIALAVAGFRLMGGEPRPLEAIADSGRVKIRGSARNVVAGSLAPANPVMGCSECGSALWTIPRGRAQRSIFGSGASSRGSRYPNAIKYSKRNLPRGFVPSNLGSAGSGHSLSSVVPRLGKSLFTRPSYSNSTRKSTAVDPKAAARVVPWFRALLPHSRH